MPMALQAAELRRLNSERAQQQLDVSRVDAEDQEVLQRNTALNKQQNALQAEVRSRGTMGGQVEGECREVWRGGTGTGHDTWSCSKAYCCRYFPLAWLSVIT